MNSSVYNKQQTAVGTLKFTPCKQPGFSTQNYFLHYLTYFIINILCSHNIFQCSYVVQTAN